MRETYSTLFRKYHRVLWDPKEVQRLREYYKEDRSVLEHFRFKDLFIHGSKKAFISFVPLEIVEKVTSGPSTTCNVFPKESKRRG